MKIYTKKGDAGETSVVGGRTLSKATALIAVLGDLDELNAALGLCAVSCGTAEIAQVIADVQLTIFDLGAEIADEHGSRQAEELTHLTGSMEAWIDEQSDKMEPLRNFILPGGTHCAAELHMARTVCRRAERSLVALSAERPVRSDVLAFINRLSDWLFCAARYANFREGRPDVVWRGRR